MDASMTATPIPKHAGCNLPNCSSSVAAFSEFLLFFCFSADGSSGLSTRALVLARKLGFSLTSAVTLSAIVVSLAFSSCPDCYSGVLDHPVSMSLLLQLLWNPNPNQFFHVVSRV
jgi:hypothetical protein